ncbi:YqcC family protein [Actinobacillus equuli]|uniref:YqcC family protein n=1 Tax=Actinobacillus equuli TaxID=718 RepID=UPI002442576A|nr:YqcC family protein [Actinobacillus equuli]WGE76351.1 YqcC family protein [Actinobacillus equuli subsp. haemolyticus]WGE78287.1 YqcC family protein [Actinobacillus equuli subsp. haemolyticus]WGE84546.1 YqcC family protein [Actinobacillus equuli subsp. equuli]
MKTKVRQHLTDLEIALRTYKQWDAVAPSLEDLANDQPFCIGTLSPTQWLQWIFIPRMHALLDAGADLPRNFSITPYLEEALKDESYLKAIHQPVLLIELLLKD